LIPAYSPQLDIQHLEFATDILAERLIPERGAASADALFKRAVQPQSVLPIAAADAQIAPIAENHVVVYAGVRKRPEAEVLLVFFFSFSFFVLFFFGRIGVREEAGLPQKAFPGSVVAVAWAQRFVDERAEDLSLNRSTR